ncbi:hypothetical protein ES705_17791 [subsurface metagenome]
MAKVKAPLFSFGASGQLAKSLVYGDWKGIDWVRQHVIPANPKTADQQQQRGYFKTAVDQWHTDGFTLDDVKAWNVLALTLKEALSGFNVFVRLKVSSLIAELTWRKFVDITIGTPTADTCDVTIAEATEHASTLYYGTSKTSMLESVEGAFETDTETYAMTGLTADTVYYFYIKTTEVGAAERTGIYKFKTAAA